MRIRSVFLVAGVITLGCALATPAGATRDTGPQSHATASPRPDVKAFGDAAFVGSTTSLTFNQPIVGIAGTKSAHGYWEVASDGGVFTYGDAKYHGSTGNTHLNQPIVGIAATPTGNGYWLVASDGGVFTFGDAGYHGSMGGTPLSEPVVGIAATKSGAGYSLVARDGGLFTFGDAKFLGSMGGESVGQSVVGIAARPQGDGYWMAEADGRVVPFDKAPGLGDAVASNLSMPVVAIAATTSGNGFWLAGRGAEAVSPEQVAEPGCASDGSQRAVRPVAFVLACGDGNARIEDASWTVWAADHASGIGTMTQNDCVPFCAAGHFHSQTADLTLFAPVEFRGHLVFSQLRVHLHGPLAPYTTSTFTLTLT